MDSSVCTHCGQSVTLQHDGIDAEWWISRTSGRYCPAKPGAQGHAVAGEARAAKPASSR